MRFQRSCEVRGVVTVHVYVIPVTRTDRVIDQLCVQPWQWDKIIVYVITRRLTKSWNVSRYRFLLDE